MKKRENCKPNIIKPYKTTNRTGAAGGLIKKMAGKNAKKNRTAHKNKGGISLRPNFTNIKLTPQTAITMKTSKKWVIGMVLFISFKVTYYTESGLKKPQFYKIVYKINNIIKTVY